MKEFWKEKKKLWDRASVLCRREWGTCMRKNWNKKSHWKFMPKPCCFGPLLRLYSGCCGSSPKTSFSTTKERSPCSWHRIKRGWNWAWCPWMSDEYISIVIVYWCWKEHSPPPCCSRSPPSWLGPPLSWFTGNRSGWSKKSHSLTRTSPTLPGITPNSCSSGWQLSLGLSVWFWGGSLTTSSWWLFLTSTNSRLISTTSTFTTQWGPSGEFCSCSTPPSSTPAKWTWTCMWFVLLPSSWSRCSAKPITPMSAPESTAKPAAWTRVPCFWSMCYLCSRWCSSTLKSQTPPQTAWWATS